MRNKIVAIVLVPMLLLGACTQTGGKHSRAVYMLLDVSGTYAKQLDKANTIINYLLGTLTSGDSLVVARIDSGSFTEKDIVADVTFDTRPSEANEQKRLFRSKLDQAFKDVHPSAHTDVRGAVLQAAQRLNEIHAGKSDILIFSDLEEDLPKGYKRNFRIPLDGIHVVALNVTKLRSDNVNPQDYLDRLARWQKIVTDNGGKWRVINDFNDLDRLLRD